VIWGRGTCSTSAALDTTTSTLPFVLRTASATRSRSSSLDASAWMAVTLAPTEDAHVRALLHEPLGDGEPDALVPPLMTATLESAGKVGRVVQAKPLTVAGVSGMLLRNGNNFGSLYATQVVFQTWI
jgi:hypothetical protein